MPRILYYVIGTALVFYGWHHYRQMRFAAEDDAGSARVPDPAALAVERPEGADGGFRCDGRAYCSQMRSCEEATWFLRHCAGMKMDGDADGVPCEKQWCGR